MCSLFLEWTGSQEQVTGPSALLFALLGHLRDCRKQRFFLNQLFSLFTNADQLTISCQEWVHIQVDTTAGRTEKIDKHILYSNKCVSDMSIRRTGLGEEKECWGRGIFIPDGRKGVGEQ